ncbi:MAG: histidine kinase, partial [Casimicrobiaceae bacterium]
MATPAIPSDEPACSGTTISTHPLEFIPFFRRFRRGILRDILYTAIWNTLFALFFALLSVVIDPQASFLRELSGTFVFAQCIGFLIHIAFMIGDRLLGTRISATRMWVRAAYFSGIPIVAIFPGYLLAFWILNIPRGAAWLFDPKVIASVVILSLMISGVLLLVFIPRERAAKAEAAMAREQARVAAAEKETADARFKLREAQLEPHFLYNTLAHVVSLVDGEPATAKRMIERLITLLRATAASATTTGTLGSQVELLRAYLDILQLRMGSRLAWRVDVPHDLSALRLPPMLLQPLVENAVKHGLEPNVEGG